MLDGQNPEDLSRAVAILRDGGLLGLPTETVYGLAADAEQEAAVRQIFTTKARPADHPLIVHVADAHAVAHFARDVPDFAQRLMAAFWPGPLTLILPRRAGVAAVAAGGQDSVGLRCPSHPIAQALLRRAREAGVHGVAAPSANRFGRVSPTTAAHVVEEFGPALPVLDGGPCAVGIESTIVDCSRGQPVLLRPGVITPAELAQACGQPVLRPSELPDAAPRASGTLEAHYAPRARVFLRSPTALHQALAGGPPAGQRWAVWSTQAPEGRPAGLDWQPWPSAPAEAARVLFAQLRAFDAAGADAIWIETPPPGEAWEGVGDRLQRAAASH